MYSHMIYLSLVMASIWIKAALISVVVAVMVAWRRMATRNNNNTISSPEPLVARTIASGRLRDWQLEMFVSPGINAVAC
jgi:hypothetical protein